MEKAFTRGQPRALAEVRFMVLGSAPHAVLLIGPSSGGKTTLALDLAAGLLCNNPNPAARPCRECRGCHQVASGNHPDLHRLAPEGPGRQIKIGDSAGRPDQGTVRHLIGELALHSVEGGARVAIVEEAHRLNDASQNALLKMLEEPPAGVTIILCADDEECLLPTVRSRCARIRLGPAAGREIERWLAELGAADPPTAARLARLAGGRPGLALAYARSNDAERLRGEIARGFLDMLIAPRQVRLTTLREMLKSAAALDAALDEGRGKATGSVPASADEPGPKKRKGRGAAAVVAQVAAQPGSPGAADADGSGDGDSPAAPVATGAGGKISAADRRSAAATLIDIWASVARDLAIAGMGKPRLLREVELLDELAPAAAMLDRAEMTRFIDRLGVIAQQLDENVNPELAMDVLALAWPRPVAGTSAIRR